MYVCSNIIIITQSVSHQFTRPPAQLTVIPTPNDLGIDYCIRLFIFQNEKWTSGRRTYSTGTWLRALVQFRHYFWMLLLLLHDDAFMQSVCCHLLCHNEIIDGLLLRAARGLVE